ncbi:carboxypeptidase [Paractinoplanes deccanensis]|uniref:Carboxypeptidase n=1 Tax=Paractinoplanes deccanensis TaxID=113561 RepID=A0ABQ3Y3A4_9ACTN|nr:M14 family zinc carboxypeptidase [Actinoplanes deccanensis]GID74448.1 carboxypeptidase [Actinoplanes deccanensis]
MRTKVAAILTATLLTGSLLASPGTARAQLTAGDDLLAAARAGTSERLVSSRPSPAEVQRALVKIARASDGRVRLGAIGRSNEGRPLRLASVGHGPLRLLFVTQQHGDEPLGTPAAIRALWTLGVPDTPWQRALLKRVTLDVVVQANPDGAVRNQRYNHDPSATGDYAEPGVGYDINRFHNPLTPIADNPVPESRAILRLWHATRPRIVVDYHMQGRYVQPDGRETTASILWPTSPLVTDTTTSRQLAVRNYDAMTKLAGANVTRYPGGDYEGIARNAYGILGSASLLVELSELPEDQAEFQIRTAYVSMLATVQGAADGSLWRIDPARADTIPARGPSLPSATTHTEDAA